MKTRSRAAGWAIGAALLTLALGSSQRVWVIAGRYTPEERAKGYNKLFFREVPLWTALADSPENIFRWRWQNLGFTCVLGVLVGGIGWGVFRLLAPRTKSEETADYADSQGEVIKDGRADATN